jgi:hypothetical protein
MYNYLLLTIKDRLRLTKGRVPPRWKLLQKDGDDGLDGALDGGDDGLDGGDGDDGGDGGLDDGLDGGDGDDGGDGLTTVLTVLAVLRSN